MSGPEGRHTDEERTTDGASAEATALAVEGEISEHDRQRPTLPQRVQRLLHGHPSLAPLFLLVASWWCSSSSTSGS